ncbi:hypothetical protein [Devosia psychrophila]|uniref:Uncharacterized protein n=1 Tax=Devosia psychrophila TaxID=728005 RepID=A0A0F5PTE1_9HYPH|nr:hypothetical protein [Devosia psychrophila]KKC31054.1 hypothetical protein WH91_21535 [Devosia psychrophila]SFD14121.1 hypothetical protein SAMN04488059_12333 [Devosia psychrophila]
MRTNQTARLLLLSSVATAALMSPAMALDAQVFVDRVAEVYKHIGYDLSFGAATLDGDTVTVDGVTVGFVGASADTMEPMTFDTELTFSGVAEGTDGSYTVESLTIPDIDTEFASAPEPVGHVTASDIRADSLYIPTGETVPAVMLLQLVGSLSSGSVVVTRDGEEVFSVEGMDATSTFTPSQGTADLVDLKSVLNISGISLDLSTVGEEDPSAAATIEALGLTSITGDITQDLEWSMADGHMALNEFLFDFADVGALNLTADFTGLTPAVLDQLYAMQAAMGTTGDAAPTDEQAQAQMMQGMAIMQGVNIVNTSVRYDDASLAGKLLDYFAEQSGTDRATFVTGLKAQLPLMLAGTGIPALNDVVIPPVEAFLDDPQSLEIKVAPPSPTSLLVLMAAAANPAGLITALGLAVEANTADE